VDDHVGRVQVHLGVRIERGAELHRHVAGAERVPARAARLDREGRMRRDPVAVQLVTDRDDPVELRGHARVDAGDRAHPEKTREPLGRGRMIGLDEQAVPQAPDLVLGAERVERVAHVVDEAVLEPTAGAPRLHRQLGREPDEVGDQDGVGHASC
jgi:hypothetical protein